MASASAGGGNQGHQAMAATAALLARRAAAVGAGDSNNRSSAFSLTCSRLSQFLKEKGTLSLGGIGLDMGRTFDNKGTSTPRTMNLLPGIDSCNADSSVPPSKLTTAPPTDQQLIPAAAPAPPQQQPRGAQMTIFYGGKVIVFDNYPADKAKEILAMAGRGNSATPQGSSVVPAPANCGATTLPVKPATALAGVAPLAATVAPASPAIVVAPAAAAPATAAPHVPHKPPAVPLASDLPIARRVSLNRFLEKRKDRINSKAPYSHPVNTAGASSSDGGKPLSDKDKQQPPPPPPVPLLEKDKQPQPQPQSWLGLTPSESL